MARKVIIVIILTTLPFVVYSFFVLFSAINHAAQIALQEPFCIQVPAKRGYKEIGSIFDLAGLRMLSDGIKNHAVLVVGGLSNPHLYHWSYWANRFVEGAYGPPPIYCKPRVAFFKNLESPFLDSKDEINFAFHGYRFSIPRSYDSRPEWPNPDTLMLTAKAPEFTPTNGVLCDEHLCNMIEIRFEISSRLEAWRSVPDDGHRIENLGETNGLVKQRVWVKGISSPSIQYFSLDNRGKVKTIILCFEETDIQCLHTFEADGITYGFHHMPTDITEWRTLQSRLVRLFGIFVGMVKQ